MKTPQNTDSLSVLCVCLLLPFLVTCVEICAWLMQAAQMTPVDFAVDNYKNENYMLKTPPVQPFVSAADVLKDCELLCQFAFLHQYDALPLCNLNVMFAVFTLSPLFAFGVSHTAQRCFTLTENTADIFLHLFTVFTRRTGEHENSSICFEKLGLLKKKSPQTKKPGTIGQGGQSQDWHFLIISPLFSRRKA